MGLAGMELTTCRYWVYLGWRLCAERFFGRLDNLSPLINDSGDMQRLNFSSRSLDRDWSRVGDSK